MQLWATVGTQCAWQRDCGNMERARHACNGPNVAAMFSHRALHACNVYAQSPQRVQQP
jgi:hypothetical protein